MEYRTPNEYGYGGNTMVGILGLLNNDDEGDMLEMTENLQSKLVSRGVFGGRFDCKTSSSLQGLGSNLGVLYGHSTIIVTGHSRHLDASGQYRPIVEDASFDNKTCRALGGFNIINVLPVLMKMIKAGTTAIEFWCCESGSFMGSKRLIGDDQKTHSKVIDCLEIKRYQKMFETASWHSLSTLRYIVVKMVEAKLGKNFALVGLNGVGNFKKEDAWITSFDQQKMLQVVNEYEKLGKELDELKRKGKDNYYKRSTYEKNGEDIKKHIDMRKCHYVKYEVNQSNLKGCS